jgi:hypothetical protein
MFTLLPPACVFIERGHYAEILVIARGAHLKYSAHNYLWKFHAVGFNKLVLYIWFFAKYAAASLKMSCSSFKRIISAFSSLTSA